MCRRLRRGGRAARSAPPRTAGDPRRQAGLGVRQFCDSRVPAHLRNEARVEADVRGRSVTIFDCRPPWHPNLTDWSRVRVAQLRYDSARHLWTLYWADRSGRWHRYDEVEPGPAEELLDEIARDPTGIFWG